MNNNFAKNDTKDIRLCHFGHKIDLNTPGVLLDGIFGKDAPEAQAFCDLCNRYYTVKHLKPVKSAI